MPGPVGFRRLRFDRNRNKITSAEQNQFTVLTVGIVGLSVGHSIAHTLALEGLCGRLRLADNDNLGSSGRPTPDLQELRCQCRYRIPTPAIVWRTPRLAFGCCRRAHAVASRSAMNWRAGNAVPEHQGRRDNLPQDDVMCWVHTLLQDGKGATSDFGEVGSDGGQRWDEIGHANWSSRSTTTRPARPCSTRWSTPTTSGTTRRSPSRATTPTVPKPQRRPPIHRQCDAAAPTSPATTADVDTAAPTSATTAAASATTAAGDDRGSGCGCSGSSGGLQLDLIMTKPDTVRWRRTRPPDGHEPIPGPLARALVIGKRRHRHPHLGASALHRPTRTQQVAMDSRQRLFPRHRAEVLIPAGPDLPHPVVRRTIRHIVSFSYGGPTGLDNGQGLCQACKPEQTDPGKLDRP